jgi:hypothetical protein
MDRSRVLSLWKPNVVKMDLIVSSGAERLLI